MINVFIALLILFALLVTTITYAADAPEGKQRGERRGPPPKEALAACENNSVGDACSFTSSRHGELSGVCFTPQEDKPLACKPEGHR